VDCKETFCNCYSAEYKSEKGLMGVGTK